MYTHFLLWFCWCLLPPVCTHSQVINQSCSIRFDGIYFNVTMNTSHNMAMGLPDVSLAAYKANNALSEPIHGQYCKNKGDIRQSLFSVECRVFNVNIVEAYTLVVLIRNISVEKTAFEKNTSVEKITLENHYIPQEKAFFCYKDHTLKKIRVIPSDNALKVLWEYKSYDRKSYFYKAEVQIVGTNNNTSLIEKCDRTCSADLTDLQPCRTYNVCVITTYTVGEERLQCFNGTTTFSGPPPIELGFTCNDSGTTGVLAWNNEQIIPSAYYSYEVHDRNNRLLRNDTTKRFSIVQPGLSDFKASVRICTPCGCSGYNRKTFTKCTVRNGNFPIWAIIVCVVGIFVLVLPCIIFKRCMMSSNSNPSILKLPPVTPRPRCDSPFYEDPDKFKVYDRINRTSLPANSVHPDTQSNEMMAVRGHEVKVDIDERSVEMVEDTISSNV